MTTKFNSELVKKMFTKEYISRTIVSLILILSCICSLFFYLFSNNSRRKIFIFPSAQNGEFVIEYRNFPKRSAQGDVNLYVDEILLGSGVERTRYLFTPGTRVLSCFQRGKVLFLNLSADILNVGESAIDIKDGVDLLEKNIKKNFPKIEKVTIFIDGKVAFEK